MISISVILSPARARFGVYRQSLSLLTKFAAWVSVLERFGQNSLHVIRSLPPIMIDVVLYLYDTRALVICNESLNVFYCQPLSMLM